MHVPKLVTGAAALTGTTMVGIGTLNASGGVFNVQEDQASQEMVNEYRGVASQGSAVSSDITDATDAAMQDHADAARTHRNAGFTALGAGAVATAAGVGSLLTRGSTSNFLRLAAVGAAGGAALAGLAGWKTYAGLDEKADAMHGALTHENDVRFQHVAELGGTESSLNTDAAPAGEATPQGEPLADFAYNQLSGDMYWRAEHGAVVNDAVRRHVADVAGVALGDDGSLAWHLVAQQLDADANGYLTDAEKQPMIDAMAAARVEAGAEPTS